MKKIWRALIVDDERLARAKLRSMLAGFPNVEIIAEADSVAEAIKAIEKTNPEIIFLDIQMPHASGFDLLEKIETDAKIIFVTAYDEYALRAFEVNALDYLLKPVSPARLAQTIERLGQTAATGKNLEYDDFIFVNSGRTSKFVRVDSIKCILAADVYSEIMTAEGEKFLLLKSLSEWESRLPAKNFLRIHRSTIINLEFIERVEKKFNYSQLIYLRGVAEAFVISRRYAAKLKDRFG
ncbi:MAG TPA: response regulator [Pyrinomonadaceae bacterium]|jgi:two-component system LytT family response regulator